MRNMKAIFGRKEEVEPRWALVEGSLAPLEEEVAVTVAVDAAAIALWKRERSSSSSGAVMAIRRGGSTRGANMNSMGREKRRARVGMSGEEGYEKRGIMENGKWKMEIEFQKVKKCWVVVDLSRNGYIC